MCIKKEFPQFTTADLYLVGDIISRIPVLCVLPSADELAFIVIW